MNGKRGQRSGQGMGGQEDIRTGPQTGSLDEPDMPPKRGTDLASLLPDFSDDDIRRIREAVSEEDFVVGQVYWRWVSRSWGGDIARSITGTVSDAYDIDATPTTAGGV